MLDLDSQQLERLSIIGILLLIGAIVIVILTPPATGYEPSMYGALPVPFWIGLVGAMFVGAFVILANAWQPAGNTWRYGLGLVLLSNVLLIALPYLRGYRMYGRSDAMSHLGFVQDIAVSGTIDGNIYPPLHLLTLSVVESTNLDVMTVGMLLPVVFASVYFGGMFFLLLVWFDDEQIVLLSLPFVLLPVLRHAHVGHRPFDVSIMLLPLLLYLLVWSQRVPNPGVRAVFVLALGGLLFYHPLTGFFVIYVLLIYVGSMRFPILYDRGVSPTHLASIGAAIFLIWYSNFTGIILRFNTLFDTLFGTGSGEPPADAYVGVVQEVTPAMVDLLRVFVFRYGLEFIIFGLAFAFIGVAVLRALGGEYEPDSVTGTLVGTVVLFSIGGVSFLILDLIVPMERPFQLAKIAAIVLVGRLFVLIYPGNASLDRQITSRRSAQTVLVVAVGILMILAVFSLYPSPLGSQNNHQVTATEVDGSEWLASHGTAAGELSQFHMSFRRFHHAAHGVNAELPFRGERPPPHFNYQHEPTYGENYGEDRYLSLNELGRTMYPEVFPRYPENWRYTPADFDRLEQDSSVERVYDNGEYDVYYVHAGATADEMESD